MSWLGNFDDFDQFKTTTFPTKSRTVSPHISNFSKNTTSTSAVTTAIQDLVPGTPNVSIVGLVVSKEEPREINCKSTNNNTSRFVLNFVVRDSVSSYISITSWGGDGFIKDLANVFHINDVVEVYNPQIQTKPFDGADKFRPWTPSPFHLNLSEQHSAVKLYEDWDSANYSSLQHVPIRPPNDYYSLNDVIVNGQGISGEHVNIQAAVKFVGAVKEMVTKKGRNAKRCEIKLFDETCGSFALILWDEEIINQAVHWNPGEYVVFGCDVRVYYDDFRSCMVATADSKTIFIVNPDTKEAHALYMFAQSQNLTLEVPESDSFGQKDPEISEVQDVLSVKGAKDKEVSVSTGNPFFCILYAHVTQFDIDQDDGTPLRYKCPKCKQGLDDNQQVCLNPPCIGNSTSGQFSPDIQYDVPLTLSDHTGSILNCRLNSNAAQEMIGLQPQDFINARGDQRTQIKWKFLLERCKIFLKIQRGRNGKTFCRVLSCTIPNLFEFQTDLGKIKSC